MEKIYSFVEIDIPDGKTDAVIVAARACFDPILPDITGTQYYEWFLSEDGRKGYVIEVYDDPKALALHSKMLDGRVAGVREHATMTVSFAGNVPEDLIARIAQRQGPVVHAGRLAFGLMTDPVPHRIPPQGDERIYALAWFRPHPGKVKALRDLARQSYDRVREADPATWGYEWFLDANGNCLALDVYRDPTAMLAHMSNCGSIMGQIVTIADSRTIVFGALPPEIEARLRPELGIIRYPRRLHGIG